MSELSHNAAKFSSSYKIDCRVQEESIKYDLIKCCLDNHSSYLMRVQLNWILYLGDLNLVDNETIETDILPSFV